MIVREQPQPVSADRDVRDALETAQAELAGEKAELVAAVAAAEEKAAKVKEAAMSEVLGFPSGLRDTFITLFIGMGLGALLTFVLLPVIALRAALAMLWLAGSAAHAGELQALIVTGAAAEPEATQRLTEVKKRLPQVDKVLTLAAGFPRVVKSDTLPGLKPGFWIVVAGYCDSAAALPALKALDAGAYAKPVQLDTPACPTVARGWAVSTSEAKDKDKRVLRAVLFDPGDSDEWFAMLALRDKTGALVAERSIGQSDAAGCHGGTSELAVKGSSLVIKTTDCHVARGCPGPNEATTAVTFAAPQSAITDTLKMLVDPSLRPCAGE